MNNKNLPKQNLGLYAIYKVAKGKQEIPDNFPAVKQGLKDVRNWHIIRYFLIPPFIFLILFSFFAPFFIFPLLAIISYLLFLSVFTSKAKKLYEIKLNELNMRWNELEEYERTIKENREKERLKTEEKIKEAQIIINNIKLKINECEEMKNKKTKIPFSLPDEYVIIDIETSGLEAKFDSIIEVAALKVKDDEVIDSFQSLIKPIKILNDTDMVNQYNNLYITDFIENLTGITNEMLHDAPLIEEVLPNFLAFIENSKIMGHNLIFDINFLDVNLKRIFKSSLKDNKNDAFIDTMIISKCVLTTIKNHKLETLGNFFNINTENNHRALKDCEIIFRVYQCLRKIVIDEDLIK